MKTNILLDMDGVLADFISAAIPLVNDYTSKEYTVNEYTETYGKFGIDKFYGITPNEFWGCIESEKDFWFNIKPFPWAKRFYKDLSNIGDVTIVTSPSLDPRCAEQKLRWLKYHLDIGSNNVFIGSKKYLMAGNGILIDDYHVNCDKFIEAGGDAIRIPSNWNTLNLSYSMISEVASEELSYLI